MKNNVVGEALYMVLLISLNITSKRNSRASGKIQIRLCNFLY